MPESFRRRGRPRLDDENDQPAFAKRNRYRRALPAADLAEHPAGVIGQLNDAHDHPPSYDPQRRGAPERSGQEIRLPGAGAAWHCRAWPTPELAAERKGGGTWGSSCIPACHPIPLA